MKRLNLIQVAIKYNNSKRKKLRFIQLEEDFNIFFYIYLEYYILGFDPKLIKEIHTIHQTIHNFQFNNMKVQSKQCPFCSSGTLQENEQGTYYSCSDCNRVIQGSLISETVNFANQQMTGKVVDINQKTNKTTTEKRLRRAKQKIHELKRLLDIEYDYDQAIDAAIRVIKYANDFGFFKKGRNIEMYAAAALYITLRFKEAPYLLIDFSDKMNVNLFKLGRCFLKLSKFLGFQDQLPLIDPSLYIRRYCRMLQLGTKTNDIIMTAVRLVQRMQRDWMYQGRRPSSLCGAAILIATKIHDAPISTSQICKTVFVCDETIRRRLDQFKQTNVAKLTREQFEKMQGNLNLLEGQMDPPAFTKARLRSQQEKIRKQEKQKQVRAIEMLKRQKIKQIPQNIKNIHWEDYKNNVKNIPQDIVNGEVNEVEKAYEQAKEKYNGSDMPSFMEQSQQSNSLTEDEIFENDNSDEEKEGDEDSEIKEQEIGRFILNEEQQRVKKNLWKSINKVWIAKEQARKMKSENAPKRKSKKVEKETINQDPYQAIKSTKIANALDDFEIRKLLVSQPKAPKKAKEQEGPRVQLNKIFNAFQWQA